MSAIGLAYPLEPSPVVNRIVRWVRNISDGKEGTRQTWIKAEFVEGGAIGPVMES